MKKLLILLLSIIVSFNAHSNPLQKNDFENKTYTYIQQLDGVHYTIIHQYQKDGILKNLSYSSDGSIWDQEDIWWVKNNFLYIQYQGLNTIPFSFNFDTNFVSFEVEGDLYDMIIVIIE